MKSWIRRLLLGTALAGAALCLANPALAMDHSTGPSEACSPGLVGGTSAPIYAHIEKAHLGRSPAQQVKDAQATDDYVLLHTVWVETFTHPARHGVVHIAEETPKPVFAHIEKAHLERSPAQQAADARATDDYLLLHMVWAEAIARPTLDVLDGGSCQ